MWSTQFTNLRRNAPNSEIPDGFGSRLRLERNRLGLSQLVLAAIGGIKRLTQIQYEKGSSSPSVRYLTAIGPAGIDLEYVLLGRRPEELTLSLAEQSSIERLAFEQLEDLLSQPENGSYGVKGRFALFQLMRANLTRQALGQPLLFPIPAKWGSSRDQL